MTECSNTSHDRDATTAVRFHRSDTEVERSYCDGCVNDLLQMGVEITGTVKH